MAIYLFFFFMSVSIQETGFYELNFQVQNRKFVSLIALRNEDKVIIFRWQISVFQYPEDCYLGFE